MYTKKQLRQQYKDLRSSLAPQERDEKSLEISNRLLSLPMWNFSYYHIFLPIERFREIDTQYILSILGGKDKNVLISKSNFETGIMTHFLLQDNTKINVSDKGIPEPVDGIEISSNKIEVVFIPLLAYDTKGNRVGYGKGFYDRFLASCSPETIKIGLSYFKPEEQISDTLPTDIGLDYCVTPEAIYTF